MNEDLEQQLRAALRRVEPDPGFAERVLRRIDGQRRYRWRLPTALAAAAVFGALIIHTWQVRQAREGLEARRQLIDALRVTGQKLDLAYRVVNAGSQPAASGAIPSNGPSNVPTEDTGV